MDRVEVEWVDSCRVLSDWTEDPEDAISEQEDYSVIVHSIGYLGGDWPHQILLIQNDGHDQILGGIIIPRVSIKKITRLVEEKTETVSRPFPEPKAGSDSAAVQFKK